MAGYVGATWAAVAIAQGERRAWWGFGSRWRSASWPSSPPCSCCLPLPPHWYGPRSGHTCARPYPTLRRHSRWCSRRRCGSGDPGTTGSTSPSSSSSATARDRSRSSTSASSSRWLHSWPRPRSRLRSGWPGREGGAGRTTGGPSARGRSGAAGVLLARGVARGGRPPLGRSGDRPRHRGARLHGPPTTLAHLLRCGVRPRVSLARRGRAPRAAHAAGEPPFVGGVGELWPEPVSPVVGNEEIVAEVERRLRPGELMASESYTDVHLFAFLSGGRLPTRLARVRGGAHGLASLYWYRPEELLGEELPVRDREGGAGRRRCRRSSRK